VRMCCVNGCCDGAADDGRDLTDDVICLISMHSLFPCAFGAEDDANDSTDAESGGDGVGDINDRNVCDGITSCDSY
jgi:hypothetical protein